MCFDPHPGLACRLGRFAACLPLADAHPPHAETNGNGWILPGRKFQPFCLLDLLSHDLVHEISHLFCGLLLLLAGGVGIGAEGEACIVMAQH